MIIDFRNINGGGGSGYTLPVATSEILGGVMVGSGLSITSAGTLSADGVDLTNYVQEQELSAYQTTQGMSGYVETTAMSGYQTTQAMSAYQTTEGMSGYVQTSAMSGYVPTTQLATTEQTGLVKIGSGITVDSAGTISVSGGGGGGIEVVTELPASGTDGQVVILVDSATSSTTEYIWSDTPLSTADIDYTTQTYSAYQWLVKIEYDELPVSQSLIVWKNAWNGYKHIVYENNEIHIYDSNSETGYTAGTSYTNVSQLSLTTITPVMVYWSDEILYAYTLNTSGNYNLINLNENAFKRTGWFKNTENKISRNVIWNSSYGWKDLNTNKFICLGRDPRKCNIKINPTSWNATSISVYTDNDSFMSSTIFAPSTTGQTGYVCVAGNGWAAPTWKDPSTLLNKSTLYGTNSTILCATDEWKLLDAFADNSFNSGNFYLYNTCDFNERTLLVDMNDAADDGEGGYTEPTQEVKIYGNTDGSYDVFYGTYADYEGGEYSYTASTHLDTVFNNYYLLNETQESNVLEMKLKPDGIYCFNNLSSCGFVNDSNMHYSNGDTITIGRMTVFVPVDETPYVYLSQDPNE